MTDQNLPPLIRISAADDQVVVLLRCPEDGCDAALLGEYGSSIEHGPGPMHTFTPAASAESSTVATPSPADVDYQVMWQGAMDRAFDERVRREEAEYQVTRVQQLVETWDEAVPTYMLRDALAKSTDDRDEIPEHEDACVTVTTPDGITARVRGQGEWTDRDKEALGEVIRAAKRQFDREHPETDGAPE